MKFAPVFVGLLVVLGQAVEAAEAPQFKADEAKFNSVVTPFLKIGRAHV